jgi:F-box-like
VNDNDNHAFAELKETSFFTENNEMPLQRQTCLRVSAQRVLRTEPLPPGESITSSLPDEILMEIFAHLTPKDFSDRFSAYEQYLPLTLVCKRWRRIYEPFLYRILDLGFHGWQNPYRVRQLWENLENRPNLHGNVRAIRIFLSNPNSHACNNIARIVAHCKAIGKVSLHTDDDLPDYASPLFDAIQNLPRLEALHLTLLSLQTVLGRFDLPNLQTLHLSRCGLGEGSNLSAPWPLDGPVNQEDLDQLLPHNRYHTGKVVSLILSNPWTPFRVTEHLLRWPARLQNLSLTSFTRGKRGQEYSLTNIERLLGMHSKSLRFVEIGIIDGIPDFSSLPYLEWLHLSRRQLLAETPPNALRKLAAPCLRHISAVSFRAEDRHREDYRDFATGQVRWFADFAALKTSGYPTSKLETIFVHFNPALEDVTWPWVYLDEAAQIVAQHGLNLTYSVPGWSKREWDENAKAGKAAKAERDAASRTQSETPAFSAEI